MEQKEIIELVEQILDSVSSGSDQVIADNLGQLLSLYYFNISDKSGFVDVLQDHHLDKIILELLNKTDSDLLLERILPFLHILQVSRFQDEKRVEVSRVILNILKRQHNSENIIWDCLKILRDFLKVMSAECIEWMYTYDAISTIYGQFRNFCQTDTETFFVNKRLFGNFFQEFLSSSFLVLDPASKILVRDILLKMISDDELVPHCQVILQHLYKIECGGPDSLQQIVLDSGIIQHLTKSSYLLLKILSFHSWNSSSQISFFISRLHGLSVIRNILSNEPNESSFLQCLKFLKIIPMDSPIIYQIIESDILTELAKFMVVRNTVCWRYSMETILILLERIRKQGSNKQILCIFKSEFLRVIGNACKTFPEGKASEKQLVEILEFIFQVGNQDDKFEELREEALAEAFFQYMERKEYSYLNAYLQTVCTERNWKVEWRKSFFHKIFVLRQWKKNIAAKSNLHTGIAASHALTNIWKLDSELARCKTNKVLL